MATVLQLKRGTATEVAAYSASGLAIAGELVLDTTNNLLYAGQADGSLERTYVDQITVSNVAPTNPQTDDLWYDTTTDILRRYTGTEWEGYALTVAQLNDSSITGVVLTHATIDAGVLVPTLTSISPATGPEAGGTEVTLTGTGFYSALGVDFGTTAAASYTIVSNTQIIAISPAGTGAVDVVVNGLAGDSVPQTFTYTA